MQHGQSRLPFEDEVQALPLWHAASKSDWRVVFSAAFLGDGPFQLLLLQEVQMQVDALEVLRLQELRQLQAQAYGPRYVSLAKLFLQRPPSM